MKYKNFRMVARIMEVLAWITGLGIFAMSLISGIMAGGATIIFGIFIGVIGGILSFIALYAFAQFIYVLLDIERNTRATVKALYEEVEREEEIGSKANTDTEESK